MLPSIAEEKRLVRDEETPAEEEDTAGGKGEKQFFLGGAGG